MRYENELGLRYVRFPLVLTLLSFALTVLMGITTRSEVKQAKDGRKPSVVRATGHTEQGLTSDGGPKQQKDQSAGGKRPRSEKLKSESDVKPSRKMADKSSASPQDAKKKRAMLLIDGALATADKISPIECSVLVRVEAAALLWQLDNERAVSILKHSIESMRVLPQEQWQSVTTDSHELRYRRRLWFLAFRKIAALKSDLIKDLVADDSSGNGPKDRVDRGWTEEARAVLSVASEQVDKDPKLAARLSEQSLSVGLADWDIFLERLSKRDKGESERLAAVLITRLRDSSVTPAALDYLKDFIFAPDRSPALREHYLQALDLRLRRDIRSDTPAKDMEGDLFIARDMGQLSAIASPRWQTQFENLASTFEAMFNDRSLPIPVTPHKRMLDVSTVSPATPDYTREIADQQAQVERIKDSETRDKKYQSLASKAAASADPSLAIEIMSKIDNEDVRRETSLMVYSPLVRKAIKESNWSQSQKYACEVLDSLGRTLALDEVAQAMSQGGEDKLRVIEIYHTAAGLLERDWPTDRVAQGFLIVAKSALPLDRETGLDALRSAASVLNKLAAKGELPGHSVIGPGLGAWVRLPNYFMRADEVFELSNMVESTFREAARRDADSTLMVADGLTRPELYSLARLAISRTLLEGVSNSPGVAQRRKVASN